MVQRCTNPAADNYHRYGGRGIKVCDRWRDSFLAFIEDMGERPEGMQIDRYPNPDGNYEPGNCRWTTPKQQARNRSRNRLVEYKGRSITVAEAAEIAGLDPRRVLQRLNAGWPIDKTLETPLDSRKVRTYTRPHVNAA